MNKTKKRMSPQQKRIEELENRVEELEQEIEKANEFKGALREFLGMNDLDDNESVTRDDVENMIDDALDNLSVDVDATINR